MRHVRDCLRRAKNGVRFYPYAIIRYFLARAAICAPRLRGCFLLLTPTTQEFDLAHTAIRVNLIVHTRYYISTTLYRGVSAIVVAASRMEIAEKSAPALLINGG